MCLLPPYYILLHLNPEWFTFLMLTFPVCHG